MWVRDAHIDAELAERLVGGGLLLFIASQWDEAVTYPQDRVLFGVYAVILAAAWLAGRRRLVTTARGLWLLSSLAVGVSIFLAGQIFNLSLNYWQGTLLWMIAALAMGWADRHRIWLSQTSGAFCRCDPYCSAADGFDVSSSGVRRAVRA